MSSTIEHTGLVSGTLSDADIAAFVRYETAKQAALAELQTVHRLGEVADMRARNRRVLTPSSRDGSYRTDEALVVDVSPTAGALRGPGYCRGDLVINNQDRQQLLEQVITACGQVAVSQPVQVEYLHTYWFLG